MNEKKIVKLLKALANPRRFRIILVLQKHRILNVSGVAEKINLSYRSTSKHLAKLEEAGLVGRAHQSRDVFYELSAGVSSRAISFIDSFARMSE